MRADPVEPCVWGPLINTVNHDTAQYTWHGGGHKNSLQYTQYMQK